MNTKTIVLASILLLGLIARPTTARAGDEALAALGGFIGGVIVGTVINDHDDDRTVIIHGRSDRYDRHDRYDRYDSYDRNGRYDRGHRPNGQWEYRTIRKWVPGYWVIEHDRYGDRRRVWIEGRHVRTQVRVWVSFGDRRHRSHDTCD